MSVIGHGVDRFTKCLSTQCQRGLADECRQQMLDKASNNFVAPGCTQTTTSYENNLPRRYPGNGRDRRRFTITSHLNPASIELACPVLDWSPRCELKLAKKLPEKRSFHAPIWQSPVSFRVYFSDMESMANSKHRISRPSAESETKWRKSIQR